MFPAVTFDGAVFFLVIIFITDNIEIGIGCRIGVGWGIGVGWTGFDWTGSDWIGFGGPICKTVPLFTTVYHFQEKLPSKVVQLSVAPLLGQAISRIHDDESISSLFGFEKDMKV